MLKEIVSNVNTLREEYLQLGTERVKCEIALRQAKVAENKMAEKVLKESQKAKKILRLAKENRTVIEIEGDHYLVQLWLNTLTIEKIIAHKEIEAKAALNKLGGKR